MWGGCLSSPLAVHFRAWAGLLTDVPGTEPHVPWAFLMTPSPIGLSPTQHRDCVSTTSHTCRSVDTRKYQVNKSPQMIIFLRLDVINTLHAYLYLDSHTYISYNQWHVLFYILHFLPNIE